MADDYQISKDGWSWGREDRAGFVSCKNADVSSRLSHNLQFDELICEENAKINVDHSATLGIGKLVCKSGTLNVSYSSSLFIEKIECVGTLDIQCAYSSTIILNKQGQMSRSGNIGTTTGVVRYSSLGECYAKIGQDKVRTEYASTWKA
jgi:hypothetical protein